MADYDVSLSQLHCRVWQDDFGLSGAIGDYGHIEFGRQGPGVLTIFLAKSSPGRATIEYKFLDDYFDIGLTSERALEVCNSANEFGGGAMLVASGGAITAKVTLFYLPLDDTGALPDEGFLRAWIGPTMSEIENATKDFAREMKAL